MIITATTIQSNRRFFDNDEYYNGRGRKLDMRLNGGTVILKTSIDDGATYQAVMTYSGADPVIPEAFDSYNVRYEIECTGNAVCRLLGGL